jgi:hypothetical protein
MRSVDFSRSTKEGRAANLERLVLDGQHVGVLAYADGVPVVWCSIAPRQGYLGLERYAHWRELTMRRFGPWFAFSAIAVSVGAG